MLNFSFNKIISATGLAFFCTFSANSIASECCSKPFLVNFYPCQNAGPQQISLSHTEGKGLGYSQGYTSLDLFLSRPIYNNQLRLFTDLRGHVFNNGKYATNAGVGVRWLNPFYNQVWGANVFYDTLKTGHRPYHQVSMGLEALCEKWEMHLNGYLPVGHHKTNIYRIVYESFIPFLVKCREQLALRGIDAEIGYHFSQFCNFDLYAGLGPYFYWGRSAETENAFKHSHKHAVGGRLRASASFLTYLSLEAVTSYDSRFKWTGQVTLSLNLPFDLTCGMRDNLNHCAQCKLDERFYQPVRRNEIIVIDRINRFSSNPEILDPEFQP